jgi:hypothetical protein
LALDAGEREPMGIAEQGTTGYWADYRQDDSERVTAGAAADIAQKRAGGVMRRRTKFGLAMLVVLAIIATLGYAAMRYVQSWAGSVQEAIGIAAQEQGRLGENASDPKLDQVEMHSSVAVEGDITTLTIRHQNQTKGMAIDLVIHQASLGKLAPKDKVAFPIRIGQLAPGATHEIALHYENVPWKLLGDDSAEVTLSYEQEWTGIIEGGPRKIDVRGVMFDVQLNDRTAGQRSTVEGPVRLDPASGRALKRRREERPQRDKNEAREEGSDAKSAS